MLNRLKYNHSIGNKINENVEHIHPLEYKMALEISDLMVTRMNRKVPDVEIGYIAIHLAAIYKMWNKKLNTVIVCDYDESILSYLKNRIVSQLEEQIKVIALVDFYQVITGKLDELTDVDIIITTSTLAGRTDIPFIQINPIMDQKDIDHLLDAINSLSQKLK
jgi:lichenan operon transcriptional antiterminator